MGAEGWKGRGESADGGQGQSAENRLASPVREFWVVVGRIAIHVVSEITGEAAAQRNKK